MSVECIVCVTFLGYPSGDSQPTIPHPHEIVIEMVTQKSGGGGRRSCFAHNNHK